MKWQCIFGHTFRPASVYHYTDTSWNQRARSTSITSICSVCGAIKEKSLYGAGWISLSDLQSAAKEKSK